MTNLAFVLVVELKHVESILQHSGHEMHWHSPEKYPMNREKETNERLDLLCFEMIVYAV